MDKAIEIASYLITQKIIPVRVNGLALIELTQKIKEIIEQPKSEEVGG